MPLIISDCITGVFEYPAGTPEWVVRDTETDIELGYLIDSEHWHTVLVPALAKIAGVPAPTYDTAARTCASLEATFDTLHRPRRAGRHRPAWLDNPIECYQNWLFGVPEGQWPQYIDVRDAEERTVDLQEFAEFWGDLHERAERHGLRPVGRRANA